MKRILDAILGSSCLSEFVAASALFFRHNSRQGCFSDDGCNNHVKCWVLRFSWQPQGATTIYWACTMQGFFFLLYFDIHPFFPDSATVGSVDQTLLTAFHHTFPFIHSAFFFLMSQIRPNSTTNGTQHQSHTLWIQLSCLKSAYPSFPHWYHQERLIENVSIFNIDDLCGITMGGKAGRESGTWTHKSQTSKNLSLPTTNLFQLCDHPEYNHLPQFWCAAKQRFNCLELGETNYTTSKSSSILISHVSRKNFILKCYLTCGHYLKFVLTLLNSSSYCRRGEEFMSMNALQNTSI